PPYLGSAKMNGDLSRYLNQYYNEAKGDLFASFMFLKNIKITSLYAMVTQDVWMYKSSYEKLRKKVLENKHIDTMLHLGSGAFPEIDGEIVKPTAFVFRNVSIKRIPGIYIKVTDFDTPTEKKYNV